MREYSVYMLANIHRTLYIGVTGDLLRRVYEHKHRLAPGFTSKYAIDRLVYFESTDEVDSAIQRERQLKGWVRRKKVALIEQANPRWEDLSASWFDAEDTDSFGKLRTGSSTSPRMTYFVQDDTLRSG
jgi:putative endonuclease